MQFIVFFTILFLGVHTFAGAPVYEKSEEKVPVKDGYEPLDLTEYQKFQKTKPPKSGQKTIRGVCRDITGKTIKPGESGYETCIQKVPMDRDHKGPENNLNLIYDDAD